MQIDKKEGIVVKLQISNCKKAAVQDGMIGLFFEDINYAADGGLYAEMIENRSFSFVDCYGDVGDYYTKPAWGYGWNATKECGEGRMEYVTGSPISRVNPWYLRFTAQDAGQGFWNKAYDGIYLEKGKTYTVRFYARAAQYPEGNITVQVTKDGRICAQAEVSCIHAPEKTWQKWNLYEAVLEAGETIRNGRFTISLTKPGTVEFDLISMMPDDAVAGVFRKDLFDLLKGLHPGFLRFPGGCIIEGNTLENRYRWKESVGDIKDRRTNFNRWAVHLTSEENGWHTQYSHYNQTLGIGNEQWQTEKIDFFGRYQAFEKAIHAKYPEIKLIGSAGPDITSEHYDKAWEFYKKEVPARDNFCYAVDEHYYVKPDWFYAHTDFYDEYPRDVKVFSGEYASHPISGMNLPQANTLGGALAEAAFLTGVERNADVVVLASYAPLFARVGYAQWSPDMIWFDETKAYGTPSYFVQKLYGENMGTVTLAMDGQEKELRKEQVYANVSLDERTGDLIFKVVNHNDCEKTLELDLGSFRAAGTAKNVILTGEGEDAYNCIEHPDSVKLSECESDAADGIVLPANSFVVTRIPTVR